MRITIPRSQGKQPYYDARKSSWGDIFPHAPKNRPQERSLNSGHIGKSGTMPQKMTREEKLALEKAKHERRKIRALDSEEKHAHHGG